MHIPNKRRCALLSVVLDFNQITYVLSVLFGTRNTTIIKPVGFNLKLHNMTNVN